MSRRTAFLDAACKENSEDFLRFIELHVSVFLIINNNNNKIRSAGICMFITPRFFHDSQLTQAANIYLRRILLNPNLKTRLKLTKTARFNRF